MLQKRWNHKTLPEDQALQDLMRGINASAALASLLLQRGITDFERAKSFFNPSLKHLHNPFLMKDMEKAVTRISEAIENGEKILVYGDYDVDGTTAVSLLYGFLIEHYENVSYYIPDRYAEGYGVSMQGIDFAYDNGVTLMIALDCGIKAINQVDYANEKGIDHHLPGKSLPKAFAILNPLQSDCEYPYKSLCGCGIGFKLVQALSLTWDLDKEEPLKYIDLVAIASASDIVPMTGENRVLTYFGMKLMEKTLRPGLAQLLEGAGLAQDGALIKKELTVTDVVFKIGPRINAAGRMKHGSLAVDLLISKTQKQAEVPAADVNQKNTDRREVDLQTLDEALEMIQSNNEMQSTKSTMLFAPHWHKGVIGIAASRIQDHYYRPTIILTESNGKASGSARSVLGFDVHAAIEKCSDLLTSFGGHPAAAGMTLELNLIDEFRTRFEKAVSETITDDQLIPSIEVDLEVNLDQLTMNFFNQIQRMAPFGPNNMTPVFVTHNLKDTGRSKCVGDGSHLKFEVTQDGADHKAFGGIGFGLGEHEKEVQKGRRFSLAYSLEKNEYRGQTSLQIMVKDIRFND
jgi:single-stranded-DNA-specific exonuclease